MENVTQAKLERKFPGEGYERFAQIAELGGFGAVGPEDAEGNISASFAGGLDLVGVLAESNKAVTDAKKSKIRELAGIAEDQIVTGGESSASKMKGKEK